MIPKDTQLHNDVFAPDKLEQKATRDGFGRGLVEAGEKDERVVALCADLAESTRAHWFKERFPNRYVELGVAEQNLATVASGMANYGKIPFIMSYASFSPGRNNEQIRTTVSLNNVPVKVVGCHAGLSVGPDGATHQALEDIALMRVQPNMTVVVPADATEAHKATVALAQTGKPAYIRLARAKSPVFTTDDTPFEIGRAYRVFDPVMAQVGIIATGSMVHQALLAAKMLESENIRVAVLNLHTIKPLDQDAIKDLAQECGAIVTVEEHQVAGGMGSAVAEFLAAVHPVPMEFIGVQDRFGQSGGTKDLYAEYGLTVPDIAKAVKKVLKRK